MNKELIKKYKAEFDHWLNGGKLQAKFVNEPWEEAPESIFSYNAVNFVLVIEDDYVEFRRALAEGKTIQMYCKYDGVTPIWDDMTEVIKSIGFVMTKDNYRIKPERHNFKKSDWVIHNGEYKQVTKAVDGYIDSLDNEVAVIMKEETLELWEPKVGEWCWVFNYLSDVPNLRRVIKVEDNFKNRFDGENFTKAVRVSRGDDLSDEVGYRFCESFIGQLPTSIKEYKKGSK